VLETPPKACENQIKCKNKEKAMKSLLLFEVSVNSSSASFLTGFCKKLLFGKSKLDLQKAS
jgi:hypothetical protein